MVDRFGWRLIVGEYVEWGIEIRWCGDWDWRCVGLGWRWRSLNDEDGDEVGWMIGCVWWKLMDDVLILVKVLLLGSGYRGLMYVGN